MDHLFIQPSLLHQLPALVTVLFRPLFEIQVVEKAHNAPEFLFVSVSQLPGKIPHAAFHHFSMAEMERLLIVFAQQRPCFVSGDHPLSSFLFPVCTFKDSIA